MIKNKKLYGVWSGMKQRCFNPNHIHYKHYGARGILICDEWAHNFNAFEKWSLSNDYQEGLTIDRINNNGNYEPSNCRWVTFKEQANNKRNNLDPIEAPFIRRAQYRIASKANREKKKAAGYVNYRRMILPEWRQKLDNLLRKLKRNDYNE